MALLCQRLAFCMVLVMAQLILLLNELSQLFSLVIWVMNIFDGQVKKKKKLSKIR